MYDLSSAEIYPEVNIQNFNTIKLPSLTNYTFSQGLPELVKLIAKRENVNNSNIVIGPSSKFLFRSIISFGSDLLIITPNWPGYEDSVKDLNIKVHTFDTLDTKLKVDIQKLDKYLSENKSINYVVLSTPNNPTGYVFSESEIEDVFNICDKYNILLIVDQAYKGLDLTNNKSVNSPLRKSIKKNLLVLNSATKTYGLKGLRVGWVVAANEVVNKIKKVISNYMTCVPLVTQELFLNVLKSPQLININIENLKVQKDKLLFELNKSKYMKLVFPTSVGTTVLVRLPNEIDDVEFTRGLFVNKEIKVFSGSNLYAPGHIRLTFSHDQIVDYAKIIPKIDDYLKDLLKY